MAEYVDLSERVTATYYDDEHEEWSQKTVTIADVLDSVCDDYTVLPSAQPDLDSAYTEGYTAAESKYRKMWDEMPKIIRCKDCKYKKVYCFPPQYYERDYCVKHEKTVDVADFCSCAERRENG